MNPQDYTRSNEGCRLTAYQDTRGVWTIGVGHTGPEVTEGLTWTQDQADATFLGDYQFAYSGAARIVGMDAWQPMDLIRRAALTDMCFQMGAAGLAGFHQMIGAIRAVDWQAAHDACLASAYAQQVPGRANANANMLLTGMWSDE